jgi:hypothetical protein
MNKFFYTGLLMFLPSIMYAQEKTRNLTDLVKLTEGFIRTFIYMIILFGVLFFVWNVFKYFIKSDDVSEKKEAGQYVMWSVIGFFVIFSLWGLVNIVRKTFNLDDTAPTNGLFGAFKSSSQTKTPFDGNPLNTQTTPNN